MTETAFIKQACVLVLSRLKEKLEPYKNQSNHNISQDECCFPNLYWMCLQAINSIDDYPLDKINRWIGFIQGCMACQGLLNVDDERKETRPIFHSAYRISNIDIPQTKNHNGV